MSRISAMAKKMVDDQKLKPNEVVENFMKGESYKLDPLQTLKMIAASSIFGEPSYYRKNISEGTFEPETEIVTDVLFKDADNKSTTEIFQDAIDKALDYDFEAVLKLAVELRNEYYMRLNPQVIMVRAAVHPKRAEWSKNNPGKFSEYQDKVMMRGDEPASQCSYYLFINNGDKSKMPSILKRSIADKLGKLGRYQINKYKNADLGMINTVRLVHANSPVLNELMKTGNVQVKEEEETWEQKKSRGMSWKEILATTKMGHMALLRNIRNVFKEIDDVDFCKAYMQDLKDGVKDGKQFPFRYESAYKTIEEATGIHHKPIILDGLEECIDMAVENLPKLKGKTVCLSDNSGSAWGALTSEYGSTTIAHIDNLSSVIAAQCSDEGYVIKFGDKYQLFPVKHRDGVLKQATDIDANKYSYVGGSTEGGIWKFFKEALENKWVYDNIFIFSDMQAGTGGLYGTPQDQREYSEAYGFRTGFVPRWKYKAYGWSKPSNICLSQPGRVHINVYKLIMEYRKRVNPKVNVFTVQTAGYDNVLVPQMSYRCAMLTGWTGKEISFAAEYIRQWDEIEGTKGIHEETTKEPDITN